MTNPRIFSRTGKKIVRAFRRPTRKEKQLAKFLSKTPEQQAKYLLQQERAQATHVRTYERVTKLFNGILAEEHGIHALEKPTAEEKI